jgi:hypothetical protein
MGRFQFSMAMLNYQRVKPRLGILMDSWDPWEYKKVMKHAVTIIGKNSSILHSVASPNSTWNMSEHFSTRPPFFVSEVKGIFHTQIIPNLMTMT